MLFSLEITEVIGYMVVYG